MAVVELDLNPKDVVIVSGIGCSGKYPYWIKTYGFHSIHGRSLPVAAGIRLANHDLKVIAIGGDGDGYSEYGGDCDDTSFIISPASPETIGNGIDDNCDGIVE